MPTVYLNGQYIPLEEACIPVTDRGFLFGDGVYEVIPAYGGRLFRLLPHLQRLQNSLDGIRLDNPHSNDEWKAILSNLLARNRRPDEPDDSDQSVYLQVTRGSAAQRDHCFPDTVTPTVYASSSPISDPDPAIADRGVAAITLDDIRWHRCDIKAVTLLANVLLRQQAADCNAAEGILLRADLEGRAAALAVTPNEELNLLFGRKAREGPEGRLGDGPAVVPSAVGQGVHRAGQPLVQQVA